MPDGVTVQQAPGAHGAVPVGGIIMWSGTVATIPANWQLCNGTNGTPDLRDRFIAGATADDAGVAKTNLTGSLTQSGGAVSHHHADHVFTQPGAHSNHSSEGGHTHDNHGGSSANATTSISIGASGAGSSHNHTGPSHQHNLTGGAATAHNHTYTQVVNHTHPVTSVGSSASGAATNLVGSNDTSSTTATAANPAGGVATGTTANNTAGATDNAGTDATGDESAHTHAAGAITEPNSGAGHSHSVTVTPTTHSSGGAHTHDAHSAHSGGAVDTHDTLSAPMPYYALAFIQRIS